MAKTKKTTAKKKTAKPREQPTKPSENPAKATAIRLLAGKTLRVGGPHGAVYGQPGDVVQVPAECSADRAKALLEAGFAELV